MLTNSYKYGPDECFHKSEQFLYVLTDRTGIFINANLLFQRSFFLNDSGAIQDNFEDSLTELEKIKYQQALQQCLPGINNPVPATLEMKLADGCIQAVKWEFFVLTGNDGQAEMIRAIGVATSATADKNTIAILKENESRLRRQATILNNVTDVIVITDLNRIITSWNKVMEDVTGIAEKDAIGKPFRQVLVMNYAPYTEEEILERILSFGIWRGEISYTDANGERYWLLLTATLLYDEEGNKTGLLGIGKDITKRKNAESGLQDSELFYRNLISHSLDGIVMTDATGNITYFGPSAVKISGYSIETILGRSLFEFVHPDDRSLAMEAFMLEFKKESTTNYLLLRLRHADGNWTWCKIRGHNLLDNPAFHSIVIYFTDDTKRKMIEDRLKESEQRFRNLVFNLKQGVLLQDEQEKLILCNNSAMSMLGLTEEQIAGTQPIHPQWSMMYEDDRRIPSGILPARSVIKTKKPLRDEVLKVCRPGTNDCLWLLLNADPVLDAEDNLLYVICSFTDITEQKKLAAQLTAQAIQKQKQITQATIDGQEKERLLIGKELHDNINQHLTTTRLYLEVAKEKIAGETKDMISFAHKNLVSIIHEIRSLSQSLVPPTLGDIGLIESVQDLADSVKRLHNVSIDFYCRHFDEQHLPENLKTMLFRVIQEQVNNIARHAGAVSIEVRLQSDAEFVTLTITDDEAGADINSLKRSPCFENIVNRVSLFNGKAENEVAAGKGCVLTVNVPVPVHELVEN